MVPSRAIHCGPCLNHAWLSKDLTILFNIVRCVVALMYLSRTAWQSIIGIIIVMEVLLLTACLTDSYQLLWQLPPGQAW